MKNKKKYAKNNSQQAVRTQAPRISEPQDQASAAQAALESEPVSERTAVPAASADTAVPASAAEEMLIQFGENEVAAQDIFEKVRQKCLETCAQADVKNIKIYVKPEDNKAYYVLNGETEGSIDLV